MPLILCLLLTGVPGLTGEDPAPAGSRPGRDLLVLDGHVGPAGWLEGDPSPGGGRGGRIALSGLREGPVDGIVLHLRAPRGLEPLPALEQLLETLDGVTRFTERPAGDLQLALSAIDPIHARAARRASIILALEDSSAVLPGRLDILRTLHRLGVRRLALCRGRTNHLADAAGDRAVHDGVSAFGRRVVEECNRLGIQLDVAGLSPDTILDLLRYSRAPLVASGVGARELHDHPGNLSDDLVLEIARRGGVIQLALSAELVSWEYARLASARRARVEEMRAHLRREEGGDPGKVERLLAEQLAKLEPLSPPPLEAWFAHLEHVVRRVGIEHVGLGSGLGLGVELVGGIETAKFVETLSRELGRRGWSEDDLRRFYGGNLLRAWRQVEMVAESLRDRARRESR